MTREETEDRIGVLKGEIRTRQNEIDKLNNELMESGTFREKFIIWCSNNNAEQLGHLAGGAVGTWCDKHLDLGSMRGCVYLCEYEEFEIYAHPDYKLDSEEETEEYIKTLESDENFMAACAQMMKENFDSFEIDW